jgi:uncharacterized phage-associated protein
MRKPYQAKTVAKFLIEAAEAAEPTICMTNSKLNSILYYVQAWYMIKYGTPCFTDQLYAYSWGVVVEDVHYTFRMFGNCSLWGIMANQIKTDEKLEKKDQKQICKVLYKMGIYDAAILNRAIMNQRPYYDIYATAKGANGIFGVITPESLREYFLWKEKNDKIWICQNLK